jgi:hypothetical protein
MRSLLRLGEEEHDQEWSNQTMSLCNNFLFKISNISSLTDASQNGHHRAGFVVCFLRGAGLNLS